MKQLLAFVLIILFIAACSTNRDARITITGVKDPVILLDGIWSFSDLPAQGVLDSGISYSDWDEINVPGELAMQGFSIKHNIPYLYARKFSIPEDYKQKTIRIKFNGVYSNSRVWINGNLVGSHQGGFTAWECDITDFVSAGEEADLMVEVIDNPDDISYGSGYAKHQIGGIMRSVELFALPFQHLEYINIETDLDSEYNDAILKITTAYSGEKGSLEFKLLDPDGRSVNLPVSKAEITKGENVSEIIVGSPVKWDSEHPELFTLTLTLKDESNKMLSQRSINVGFREIEIEGNMMLVNGDPVKLRGACRHDIHPLLGRTTTPEYDLLDVLLAKEANINFIRTSHYPPSELFLDYCDQYGIYVEDETAVCFVNSHRSKGYDQDEFSASSEENQYLSQVIEMLKYHRNHPSVIMWSVGNENYYNENFKLTYDFVKENDPTRPVVFSYPGGVPDSVICYDILSMHYPTYKGDVNNQRGITVKDFEYEKMPVLFDEWAHVACYNKPTLQEDPGVRNFWGESLDKMWAKTYDSEGGLGGAIWGYIDETFMLPKDSEGFNKWWGIMDEKILPAMYEGHTVGYGEWGIIDTWRRKKPEFWNTKKAYSPFKIMEPIASSDKAREKLFVTAYNRFNHTNFNELTLEWTVGDITITEGGPELEPRQKGKLFLPDLDFGDQNTVHLKASVGDRIIDEFDIRLKNMNLSKKLPNPDPAPINVVVEENGFQAEGDGFSLNIINSSGMIENLISGKDTLIKHGPYPRITIPEDYIFYSTIKMANISEMTEARVVSTNIEEDKFVVHVEGVYGTHPLSFKYVINGNGVLQISYEVGSIEEGTRVQEAGLGFSLGEAVSSIEWERNGYWSFYPPGHPGSNNGTLDFDSGESSEYRERPNHSWAEDLNDFYYQGNSKIMRYSKSLRSLREDVLSYRLSTDNSNLWFQGEGKRAFRVSATEEGTDLYVNSEWDYTSLLWGNYDRGTYVSGDIKDTLVIIINR